MSFKVAAFQIKFSCVQLSASQLESFPLFYYLLLLYLYWKNWLDSE